MCKQSIANALKRLEAAGILKITRRLVRETIDGVTVCRQGSNLYVIFEPGEHADRLPVGTPKHKAFRRPAFSALAKLLQWRAAPVTVSNHLINNAIKVPRADVVQRFA